MRPSFGTSLSVLALAAIATTAQAQSGGQASLTLKDCNSALCNHNNTDWTLSKKGTIDPQTNAITWTVDAVRGATSNNVLTVDGYLSVQNTGTAPATIGNMVVNLQRPSPVKKTAWISAAANVANATNGDAATVANIVAFASQENPGVNAANGPGNYTVTGQRGTFVETAGSGSLSFTDADNNTVFSLVPQLSIPVGATINMLFTANFDNTILAIPVGTQVRAEFIVTFGNHKNSTNGSAANIDINGDGGVDNLANDGLPAGLQGADDGDEKLVRSVPCRITNTVPALEQCNDTVTLTDDLNAIATTGTVTVLFAATDIGGGSGTEAVNATSSRVVTAIVDAGAQGGNVLNCASLAGSSSSTTVDGPIDPLTGLPSVIYTFPCCVGVDLTACDEQTVTAPAGFQEGDFCTYSQGGWGNPGAPGVILATNFAAVYPSGVEVGIAGAGGFSMKFSTAAKVAGFLPAGGSPNKLTADLLDPSSSAAGVLGGQVLALQISVDYSAAGVTQGPRGPLGNLVVANTGTSFDGLTVSQVLAAANQAIGGGGLPAGFSFGSLNAFVANLNLAFDNCVPSPWAQCYLVGGASSSPCPAP